jgi:hypothetical protein
MELWDLSNSNATTKASGTPDVGCERRVSGDDPSAMPTVLGRRTTG